MAPYVGVHLPPSTTSTWRRPRSSSSASRTTGRTRSTSPGPPTDRSTSTTSSSADCYPGSMGVRSLIAVVLLAGCASHHHHNTNDAGLDAPYVPDACVGLQCFQFDCSTKTDPMGNPLPPTTLSGTVYAPNGTLPLYGVNVYVPENDPGPLPDGASCDQCAAGLQGGSLAATITDEAGHFDLQNVPA